MSRGGDAVPGFLSSSGHAVPGVHSRSDASLVPEPWLVSSPSATRRAAWVQAPWRVMGILSPASALLAPGWTLALWGGSAHSRAPSGQELWHSAPKCAAWWVTRDPQNPHPTPPEQSSQAGASVPNCLPWAQRSLPSFLSLVEPVSILPSSFPTSSLGTMINITNRGQRPECSRCQESKEVRARLMRLCSLGTRKGKERETVMFHHTQFLRPTHPDLLPRPTQH